MTAATEPELYWEQRVADSLGVARQIIVRLRKKYLKAGEHFEKRQNAVVLTIAGLARITQLVKAESPPTPDVPAGPRPRAVLVVFRLAPNVKMMWCHRQDDQNKKQLLVRVSDNRNFMAGMEFEAVEGGENLWQYTGRLPRRKGRW